MVDWSHTPPYFLSQSHILLYFTLLLKIIWICRMVCTCSFCNIQLNRARLILMVFWDRRYPRLCIVSSISTRHEWALLMIHSSFSTADICFVFYTPVSLFLSQQTCIWSLSSWSMRELEMNLFVYLCVSLSVVVLAYEYEDMGKVCCGLEAIKVAGQRSSTPSPWCNWSSESDEDQSARWAAGGGSVFSSSNPPSNFAHSGNLTMENIPMRSPIMNNNARLSRNHVWKCTQAWFGLLCDKRRQMNLSVLQHL